MSLLKAPWKRKGAIVAFYQRYVLMACFPLCVETDWPVEPLLSLCRDDGLSYLIAFIDL